MFFLFKPSLSTLLAFSGCPTAKREYYNYKLISFELRFLWWRTDYESRLWFQPQGFHSFRKYWKASTKKTENVMATRWHWGTAKCLEEICFRNYATAGKILTFTQKWNVNKFPSFFWIFIDFFNNYYRLCNWIVVSTTFKLEQFVDDDDLSSWASFWFICFL